MITKHTRQTYNKKHDSCFNHKIVILRHELNKVGFSLKVWCLWVSKCLLIVQTKWIH